MKGFINLINLFEGFINLINPFEGFINPINRFEGFIILRLFFECTLHQIYDQIKIRHESFI
jgi:hypothetical protein